MNYRADISIRARGESPMDRQEFKSENYDTIEDMCAAIAEFIVINIDDYEEGEDDD